MILIIQLLILEKVLGYYILLPIRDSFKSSPFIEKFFLNEKNILYGLYQNNLYKSLLIINFKKMKPKGEKVIV